MLLTCGDRATVSPRDHSAIRATASPVTTLLATASPRGSHGAQGECQRHLRLRAAVWTVADGAPFCRGGGATTRSRRARVWTAADGAPFCRGGGATTRSRRARVWTTAD